MYDFLLCPTLWVHRCACLQLTLEFYERKKTSWLFPAEITNWEVWHIHLAVFDPSSEEGGCGFEEVGLVDLAKNSHGNMKI